MVGLRVEKRRKKQLNQNLLSNAHHSYSVSQNFFFATNKTSAMNSSYVYDRSKRSIFVPAYICLAVVLSVVVCMAVWFGTEAIVTYINDSSLDDKPLFEENVDET